MRHLNLGTAMRATSERPQDDAPEPAPRVHWHDVREEEAYWQRAFWQERYYRWDRDFEDYAPAYCVGYAGAAQYGGEFAQAQVSLCANWERIRGDSRLSLDEAMPAIRAAWDRMARRRDRRERPAVNDPSFAPATPAAAEGESAAAVAVAA
jgi:hypothetical protein